MCIIQQVHWNQGGVKYTFWTRQVKILFTPVLHHPLPQPDHFLKEIYIVTSGIIVIASTWKFFQCSLVGLLDICIHLLLCGKSWQYQQIRCFGGSSHHKQLLHCNHQPEIAWHGRLSTDLTNLNSKIQSGHTKTAQKNSFIQTFFWNFQMCRAVLCYIWMALAT